MRTRRIYLTLAAAVVAAWGFWHFAPAALPAHASGPVDGNVVSERAASVGFAEVIEKVQPAVVNISVAGHIGAGNDVPFDEFEDFLRRFFDRQSSRDPGAGPVFRGMGSGFMVDPEGYVVTNNHVVDNASEITVTLNDGTRLPAELVGTDEKTDLALLKVDAKKELPYARFGDSESARVGDWIIAIGNPFGLGGSATVGIISARGRDIQSGPYDDFFQIDAPINQGNSGGPLFDVSGRVIGVNTAIYSPNGGNIGIGFAIPSKLAESVIAELKSTGHVTRGWLGVTIQPVDEPIAKALGLEKAHGALVADVTPGSPAAKAGLSPGDVIVSVDGQEIENLKTVTRAIAERGPGADVAIEILRERERKTVHATLGDGSGEARESRSPAGRLGFSIAPVPSGSPHDGVLITGVEPTSPAAESGIRAGDIIVGVGNISVRSVDEARAEIEKARSRGQENVLLRILRGDGALFVAVPFA
ncbi:MAG TPA: DegQ family serine endoprotease [Vicinamibacteria bacterium]|nr:DegQ family serine endoprotease [Vicinamibacteria bacterium]